MTILQTNRPSKPTVPVTKGDGFYPTKKQAPVAHKVAEQVISNRSIPSNVYRPVQIGDRSSSLQANLSSLDLPTNITELARALKFDPDLIFECVHNNIEWLQTFGSQKGAAGALIDGCGNAFDQSELMVLMLRASGYQADFQFGELELSENDASSWFGTTNIFASSNLLASGGIPNETFWTGTEWRIRFSHVWVVVNISGTSYVFDPARKSYTSISGIDLESAMGFNESTFLSQSLVGATVNANYVEDVNRGNLRNKLADYNNNLRSWIQANKSGADISEILGTRQITPVTGIVRQTALPYLRPGTTPTTWTSIPDTYKATLRVLYDTIDQTFFSGDIHGKRLTLFFNAGHEAELRLDGLLIATSSPQGVGTWNSVFLESEHPYPTTFADEGHWQIVWTDKWYLIAQAWGNAGRQMTEIHRDKLARNRNLGASGFDEPAFGEYLCTTWHMWNNQKSIAAEIVGRLTNCTSVLHHQTGLVGYYDTIFTDLGGIVWSASALDNNWNKVDTNNTSLALHGIAMEASVIQEMASVGGASTTPIVDIATQSGMKIYNASSANWLSTVKPALTNYSPSTLNDIENWWINAGWRVALPENGQIVKDSWNGFGYYAISPGWGAIGIITGGLKGGSGTYVVIPEDEEKELVLRGGIIFQDRITQQDEVLESEEPVGFRNGAYIARVSDISVGGSSFPHRLEFSRQYSSQNWLRDGALGRGWTHNLNGSLSRKSIATIALGDSNALAAAASLVEFFVSTRLLEDLTKPIAKWVIVACCNQWLVDQFYENIISVSGPGFTANFLKQPDGSFTSANGENVSITQNPDGSYKFTAEDKAFAIFDSAGKIQSISTPFGVTVSFGYTGAKLTSVSNGTGRTLTLSYSGDRIGTVSDGSRTVAFSYDTNGNLISAANARNKVTTYEYGLPGLLTKIFLPANPTNPIVSNTYDSLNRVKEQRDAYNNLWQFFFAGYRTEEVSPTGTSRIVHYDKLGKPVQELVCSCSDEPTKREYDALGRLVRTILPEGNGFAYTYNSKNQLLEVRQKPKPGSSFPDLVKTFTYDPIFGHVASSTDPSGSTVSYFYDSVTGLLNRIEYPQISGQTPTVQFSYNGAGQLESVVDQKGTVTKMSYSGTNGDLLSTVYDYGVGKLNLTTSYGYNAIGDLTSVSNLLTSTAFEYDACRAATKALPPSMSAIIQTIFDDNQLAVTSQIERGDPLEPWDTVSGVRRIDGLVTARIDQYNNQTVLNYDNLRRLTSVMDPENSINSIGYDTVGRVSFIKDAQNVTVDSRTYTENGLIASYSDANSNTTTLIYDDFDRLKKVVYPDSSYFEVVAYHSNGSASQIRYRSGQTADLTYTALGMLQTITPQGKPTISLSYNLASELVGVSTPAISGDPASGAFSRTLDALGRVIQETYPDGKAVSYQYDAIGNLTRLTYPDGYYVERVYDLVGRLTDVKLNGSTVSAVQYEYNKLSQRIRAIYSNGTITNYRYDLQGNCISIEHKFASEEVQFGYRYDALRQVVASDVSNPIYAWSPVTTAAVNYGAANSLNQYPIVAGQAYAYNSNGCLTSNGAWTFAYGAFNELISATSPSASVLFSCDPYGRQVQKQVGAVKTGYVYAGYQRIAEYDNNSGSLTRRFVYGATLDELALTVSSSGVIQFVSHDLVGSAIATTDGSGAIVNRCSYSPWGESANVGAMPVGFTGQRFDVETGLYYFKTRYYDPSTGRFLQPDILQYASSFNSYQYAKESPFSFVDSLGLEEENPAVISAVRMRGVFALAVAGLLLQQQNQGNGICITDGKANEMYNSPSWGGSSYDAFEDLTFAQYTQWFANAVGCPPPGATSQQKGQWGEALTQTWFTYQTVLSYHTSSNERLQVTFGAKSVRTRPDIWYLDPRGQFGHGSWAEVKTTEGVLPPIASLSFTNSQKVAYPALAMGLGTREYGKSTPFVAGGGFNAVYSINIPLPIQLFRVAYRWV